MHCSALFNCQWHLLTTKEVQEWEVFGGLIGCFSRVSADFSSSTTTCINIITFSLNWILLYGVSPRSLPLTASDRIADTGSSWSRLDPRPEMGI